MQLIFLFSIFLFSLALGSPSDVLYIEKLVADESQLLDVKDFAGLVNIFTRNATYSSGPSAATVYGIGSIQAVLAEILPPESLTHGAISTESITLKPPFDEQGAAGTATGVVYAVVTYIGQGDLAGQGLTFFAKYVDKYVKTADLTYHGGWRISSRFFIPFVSCPKVDSLETQRGRGGYFGRYLRILMTTDPLVISGRGRWQQKTPSAFAPGWASIT